MDATLRALRKASRKDRPVFRGAIDRSEAPSPRGLPAILLSHRHDFPGSGPHHQRNKIAGATRDVAVSGAKGSSFGPRSSESLCLDATGAPDPADGLPCGLQGGLSSPCGLRDRRIILALTLRMPAHTLESVSDPRRVMNPFAMPTAAPVRRGVGPALLLRMRHGKTQYRFPRKLTRGSYGASCNPQNRSALAHRAVSGRSSTNRAQHGKVC